METLNRMATELVDEAIDFADELAIEVRNLDGGAVVLDVGVEATGGREAGLMLAEIGAGGLATVLSRTERVAGAPLTHVELSTDHPALALLCSSKASWELAVDGFEGLGGGPARALVAEEDEFARTGFGEDAEFAVLTVESETRPDDAVAAHVAERTGVPESAVFLPSYRTASIAGTTAAAARAAELATVRLADLGYDPRDVLAASGVAPAAPVPGDEGTAIARTTDALAYGGRVHLTVAEPFDRFDEVASTAAEEYGTPLAEAFDAADWEFTEVPIEVFAPAQVTVDVVGGDTHVVGDTHEGILAESFGL